MSLTHKALNAMGIEPEKIEQILEMPIKCDVEITKAWYGEKIKV